MGWHTPGETQLPALRETVPEEMMPAWDAPLRETLRRVLEVVARSLQRERPGRCYGYQFLSASKLRRNSKQGATDTEN